MKIIFFFRVLYFDIIDLEDEFLGLSYVNKCKNEFFEFVSDIHDSSKVFFNIYGNLLVIKELSFVTYNILCK